MHGRKKQLLSTADEEKIHKKRNVYGTLLQIIFSKRKLKEHTNDSLELTEKLLIMNPDFYSLWNFRREILLELHPMLNRKSSDISAISDLMDVKQKELLLSAEAIRRNSKSCKS